MPELPRQREMPPATAAPEPLLVDEPVAGKLLSLAPGTVGAMARAGELPSIKVRGRRLYSLEDLRAWVRAQPRQVRP